MSQKKHISLLMKCLRASAQWYAVVIPLLTLLTLIGSSTAVFAQARFSVATGNWNSTATWSASSGGASGASVPIATDAVTIERGFTVTVDINNAVCASVQVGGLVTGNGTLAFAASSQLTVSGSVTLGNVARTGSLDFTSGGRLQIGAALTVTTIGTFTPGTGTIEYNAAGAQNVATTTALVSGYNNLTLSNSGAKTFPAGTTTVNGILSMEGTATATVTGTLTYGAAATLQYNTATGRTVGAEWLATFPAAGSSTGGVLIANTGTITLNAAKVVNAPLTINSGAALTTGNFQLTFGGNFVNSGGTFTAGSSPIVIANTVVTQSIAGFTTTGLVSMTKTGGTATFTGNVNGAALTINGGGGTLDLGSGLTHTFTGVVTLTAGTLNGGSSTLNENAVSATAWNGTGTVFSAGTGTVNFGAAGNQTLSASATTFNNLTFSTSGTKTLGSATTANGTLTINNGVTLSANTRLLTLGGDFSNLGTFTSTTGGVTITGSATQSIAGFTTTGTVSMTKTGGTATFTGNVNGAALTINGGGGTLDLGSGLTHTFTGVVTLTAGTLNGSSSTLNENAVSGTAWNGTGTVFSAGTGTVNFGAAGNQTLSASATTFNNLTFSTSGTKTLGSATTANGNLTINIGVTLSANTRLLTLGGDFSNLGTFTSTTGGVTMTGTATQSIAGFTTTGTVSMTKTAGTATFAGNVNGAALTINGGGGTLDLGSGLTHTFTGAVTLTAGTLNGNSSTLNENMVSVNAWSGTGTVFSAGTGTVNFGAVGNQTLSASTTTFNNLTFSTSGTKTLGSATAVNGNLTISGTATVADNGFQITGNASGTMTMGTGSFLTLGIAATGTSFPTNFVAGKIALDAASTVTYNSSVAQTILRVPTYGNLTLTTTLAITKTLDGDLTVGGTLTINNLNTLSVGAGNYAIYLAGNWSSVTGSVFTPGTGTVTFNGSGAQQITGTLTPKPFYNLTVAKSAATLTAARAMNIDGDFLMATAGGTFVAGAFAHTVAGNWTISAGTFTSTGSTISFDGTGAQSVSSNQSFNNLTVAKTAGTLTATSALELIANFSMATAGGTFAAGAFTHTVAGNWTISNGTFTNTGSTISFDGAGAQSVTSTQAFNNFTVAKTAGTLTATGALNIDGNFLMATAGGTFSAGAFTHNIGGNWTVSSGTFTAGTSTISFDGTGAQSVSSNQAFNNFTVAKTAGTLTATSTLDINGSFAMATAGGTFAAGAFTHNVFGNWTISNGTFTNTGSTINFDGTGAQSVTSNQAFNNFTVAKTAGTLTATAALNIDGSFLMATAGGTFAAGAFTHNIGGNWTISAGTFTNTGSTISFDGTGAQSVTSNQAFNNFTVAKTAGTLTATTALDINGNFVMSTAGGTFAAGAFTHNVFGNWTISNGTFTNTGSTISFDGTGAQSVTSNQALNNFTVAKTAGTLTATSALNIDGNILLSTAGGTFAAGAFAHNVGGNWTNNGGTFTGGGSTVTFNGSGQSIGGSSPTTFNNLTISGTTVTLTNNAPIAGDLSISTGTFDLATYLADRTFAGGTLTLSNGTLLKIGGPNTLPANFTTKTIGASSTVEYYGAAQNLTTGVTYGHLTVSGSASKTSAANLTVAGNLTLNQNILQTSGALTMTSTTPNNVSGTGEVQGAVRRNHNFTAGSNYLFNRANVYIGTATTAGTDITLAMSPNTDPTSPATTKYVKRKYAITPTTAGNLQTIQLYYATGEPQGGVDEAKLGLRSYNGTSWSKINNAGQVRSSGSNLVTYSGFNNSLSGVQELGLYGINFISFANGADLSTNGGWDENAQPDVADDAIVAHTGVVTGATAVNAGTLTINSSCDLSTNGAGALTVSTSTAVNGTMNVTTTNANLAAITVGASGQISVNSGRTLTGTSLTNNSSNASTFTGNVSLTSLVNNGTGALNFNGTGSSITGAVTNVAGATISVAGTLSIMTSSVLTLSSDGNITLSGGSAVLNVGISGFASSLTMSGTSTLTINNAGGQLNVFGNLTIGATSTFNNIGIINVGE